MVRTFERSGRYYPQVIEAEDDDGRCVVRASRHQASREWTVTINTAPRSLPDLHLVGKGEDTTLVRNLVEVLTEAIEDRSWMPTYEVHAGVYGKPAL